MKKVYKIFLCSFLVLALVSFQKVNTKGFVSGLKRSSSTWLYFTLYPETFSGQAAMKSGMSAWVNTPTPVGASEYSSGSSIMQETFVDDVYLGISDYIESSTSSFIITLNRTKTDSLSINSKQSTIVHELGHCWHLGDISSYFAWLTNGSVPTIMYYDRDRNTMYIPQQDDINGVNFYY